MVTLRKPVEESEYDVYNDVCPARAVLDHIGDKWALLILHRLREQPMRFNALRRDIRGISQKVLSQVLKRLERDGMISRTVFPTVPVTVQYELTTLGGTLKDKVSTVLNWAEAHMLEIRAAQEAYDMRAVESA